MTGFPEPRKFQTRALENLRSGFRSGHRAQVLMAATGSGKTYTGLYLISEALKKGKRALFVCDRKTLIEQTSRTADAYGLSDHGVIQANHWRKQEAPFQICSTQTLARRGWPISVDLIVCDEVHSQYRAWTDHIQNTPKTAWIGLSATPFSAGLGKLFTNLVNAETMHQLTEDGILVPMRVLTGREVTHVDMTGAKTKSDGEWTDEAASERGMRIIGDVVTEWQKHAEGLKTICFGATINHCEAIAKQFNEAGIWAATFTQRTTDKQRESLLGEFRKEDSELKVLVSVEALAKGFDCISEGSRILTDKGYVAIEKLSIDDKIWDGCEFVSHEGPIFKGEQDVITYAGLTATPSHLVKTAAGWETFVDCAKNRTDIIQTAEGGRPIQESHHRFRGRDSCESKVEPVPVPLSMHGLRVRIGDRIVSLASKGFTRLFSMFGSAVATESMQGTKGEVRENESQGLFRLWWAWNQVLVFFSACLRGMGGQELGFAKTGSSSSTGSNQQRWSLRTWKPSVGIETSERLQHKPWRMDGEGSSFQDGTSRDSICGQDASKSDLMRSVLGTDNQALPPAFRQTKRRVWDVLNAGPRNCFTCEGLLVHNCADVACIADVRPMRKSLATVIQMWGRGLRSHPNKTHCTLLDFSGNAVRFGEDFEKFFYEGLDKLDDGKKLEKKVRTKEAKDAKSCPRCNASPFFSRCVACGYTKPIEERLIHVPGEMMEFSVGKHRIEKKDLWIHCLTYCKRHSRTGKIEGWAMNLYKDIAGTWPPRDRPGISDIPEIGAISPAVINKAKQNSIARRSVEARAS